MEQLNPLSRQAMQVFRVRCLLRMSDIARMHAHHAAILYATLAQANGVAKKIEPSVPDGVLLDAPEQTRLWLAKDSSYAFGFTLLTSDPGEAGQNVDLLVQGLRKIGRVADRGKLALGGNFEVERIDDLVAKETHRTGHALQPIAREWFETEVVRLTGIEMLTLRFCSPLRAHRGKKARHDGHQFFDREHFHAPALLNRMRARLEGLGLAPSNPLLTDEASSGDARHSENVSHSDNRLVWLDL